MRHDRTILIFAAVWTVLSSGAGAAPQDATGPKEIGRTTERELNVVLSSSFGTFLISRGESEKILVVETASEKADPLTNLDYAIRNRVGYADLTLGDVKKEGSEKKKAFKLGDFNKGKWYIRCSDAVPISFDVELGVGRGDFNLSGLQVKDFNLSAGASDVTLSFDEPNKTRLENINIESGVSKFDGRNLGNANFRHFRFQGGVGSYTLDFGGTLSGEVDADIEVGMGVLTIIVPQEIGARVYYEKSWVSRLDCDRDFHTSAENEYLTDNYNSSAGRMNIRIDSGMGSIKIRRR
jgi:hypothetical protein